jgi:hypothetical protein
LYVVLAPASLLKILIICQLTMWSGLSLLIMLKRLNSCYKQLIHYIMYVIRIHKNGLLIVQVCHSLLRKLIVFKLSVRVM